MTYYVYRITNIVTGWVYIGKTFSLEPRWKAHKSKMKHGKHNIMRMQEDYRNYGLDSFVFEIVEVLETNEEMLDLERKLIKECVAGGRCYNLAHNSFDARLANYRMSVNQIVKT